MIHCLRFTTMFGKNLSAGHKLLFIFLVTILAPGLLLAVVGARFLWQERASADRRLQERVDQSAESAARVLAQEISGLQAMVDLSAAPDRVFRDLPADGSWVYAERQDGKFNIYPPNILPFELNRPADAAPLPPEIARVEEQEMRDPNPERDIAGYRDLLVTAKPAWIPEVKHRLARVLRRSGREAEAVRLWKEVENADGRIGVLPADLVALFELAVTDDAAARRFQSQLNEGRWRLEKARFLSYAQAIRERLGEPERDDPKIALAQAVEEATGSSTRVIANGNEPYLVFRRQAPFAALVLSPAFLKARVWPRVLEAADRDMDVVRITANTHTLYAAGPSSADLAAVRALEATDLRWQIEARPRDAAALRATMYRTTNFYLAMLSLVVVLLAFGGYLIVRVTRRELEVARMKEEFVSTVSHEFRAPLTGIRQLGEILSRDRVSDERKRHQYYDLIVRESVRLTRLVENVLDFARVNKPYNFETLDTTSWLSAVAEEFRIEASRSGHMLEASIPANLPSVSGDREALSTAVRNLLDNACKYSPRAETVWLEAEAANGGVRVAVRDRGVGIPLREQRRIFEKFYRGEQLSKTVKGVGLGLSLVQRTVEAHRGRVQVDSREGEGSTFSIYLEAAS